MQYTCRKTIPQCTSPKPHNTPFCKRNVHMCAHFCYEMLHCGIFVWCIVGFCFNLIYYSITLSDTGHAYGIFQTSISACVITWLCTDSPLQDCCIVLFVTSKHPTHSKAGAVTVAESSCTHSFPHNDPMHGFADECVQYCSPPRRRAPV